MIPVKICGITNLDDALCAAQSGARAVGFIFYRKSPRYVSPELVRRIVQNLPRRTATVGVFVNEDAEKINETVVFCGLDFIQLHGDETADFCRRFPSDRLIKAASLQKESDLVILKSYAAKAILIDSKDAGLYGGTGKTVNWKLAQEVKKIHPLILSGGLNAGNIRQAVEMTTPDAVDINSGVEISPGKKDHDKIREIMEIVKRTGEAKSEVFTAKQRV